MPLFNCGNYVIQHVLDWKSDCKQIFKHEIRFLHAIGKSVSQISMCRNMTTYGNMLKIFALFEKNKKKYLKKKIFQYFNIFFLFELLFEIHRHSHNIKIIFLELFSIFSLSYSTWTLTNNFFLISDSLIFFFFKFMFLKFLFSIYLYI